MPDNYDPNRPYRLIFGFHWNGGSANDVDSGGTSGYPWSYYGIRALSNNSAIFVAPQGLNAGWANTNNRDLTFVDDMVRTIQNGLCVDTTQLFAMGFSYGGGMSYSIACSRASVFRAVAVYAGGQLSGCSGGTDPIAYIGIHGLRDNVLNISQGRALRDRFVRNNGCTPQNPREPAAGSLTHVVTAYSGCRAGYPVVWARVRRPARPQRRRRDRRRLRPGREVVDQAGRLGLLRAVPVRDEPDADPDHDHAAGRITAERHDRRQPVQPVRGRPGRGDHQRHPGGPVGLQRPDQPALDVHRRASS